MCVRVLNNTSRTFEIAMIQQRHEHNKRRDQHVIPHCYGEIRVMSAIGIDDRRTAAA